MILNYKNDASVTPQMAMDVAKAYLERFWPDHQAVLVVHLKGHQEASDEEINQEDEDYDGAYQGGIHIHACINSVNMMTGRKVDRSDVDLALRKDAANDIAYDLYGIAKFDWREAVRIARARAKEESEDRGADNAYNSAEQHMHRDGRESELDVLRKKILRCAMTSKNRRDFEDRLNQEGITLMRNTPKTISYRYKDGPKGTVRGGTLGYYYTAKYIDELLAYNCRMALLQDLDGSGYPEIDLARLRRLRKTDKDSYKLARQLGLEMAEGAYWRASEMEIRLRIAIGFVQRQNQAGIGCRGAELCINGYIVQTDERLQKMYDMLSLSKELSQMYGCGTRKEFTDKATEIASQIDENRTELRKNRKIESALKDKLARKEALVQAMKRVEEGLGTAEEMNQAKRLLYRNGYKTADFGTHAAALRLRTEVRVAKEKLEEQQQHTRSLYYEQRNLQRVHDGLWACVQYNQALDYEAMYYGPDPMWMQRLDEQLEQQRDNIHAWTEAQDRGFRDMTVDSLLEVAGKRANEESKMADQADGVVEKLI